MLKDAAGNRLFRKMTVKVIFPDNIFPERTYVQHAGPKQGFGPDGIHALLDQIAEQLDTLYPWWDFESVELKPEGRTTRYVIKFAGYRATPPATTINHTADSNTPESETAESTQPAEDKNSDTGNTLQSPLSQELVQP
jgi:hypothetical protein